MLADELAVDVNVGVIIDRPEAQERTLTGLGVHGKMALVPDEAVVPAHVRRMGDKGLRQVDHRRAVHVIFVQRLWIRVHGRGGVDVVVAPVPGRSLAAVEAGEAVAIRIDRPVPRSIEVDRLAHVGADQHRLCLSGGGREEEEKQGQEPAPHTISHARFRGLRQEWQRAMAPRRPPRAATAKGVFKAFLLGRGHGEPTQAPGDRRHPLLCGRGGDGLSLRIGSTAPRRCAGEAV